MLGRAYPEGGLRAGWFLADCQSSDWVGRWFLDFPEGPQGDCDSWVSGLEPGRAPGAAGEPVAGGRQRARPERAVVGARRLAHPQLDALGPHAVAAPPLGSRHVGREEAGRRLDLREIRGA